MVNTESFAPTTLAKEVLNSFASHLKKDHDMEMQRGPNDEYFIEHAAFRVEFRLTSEGIRFGIRAPNESALIFFKEEIAEHLAEVDPAAARELRWSGEASSAGDLPPNFHILTVAKSEVLHTGLQRVIAHFPGLSNVLEEGIHLRVMLPKDLSRTPQWPRMAENGAPEWPTGDDTLHARFVTIADVDVDKEEVALDIVRHGDGLISQWAQMARSGAQFGAMGPAGMSAFPAAEHYLLGADLTALPSLARLIPTLPDTATGDVVVDVSDDFPVENYLQGSRLSIHRVNQVKGNEAVLHEFFRVAELRKPDFAWFAGEFDTAQDLRNYFKKKLGLGKGNQLSVAYWRRGHPGFGS